MVKNPWKSDGEANDNNDNNSVAVTTDTPPSDGQVELAERSSEGNVQKSYKEDDDAVSVGAGNGMTVIDSGVPAHEYKVYKRRWFGLVQLTLLNIIVSWDVSRQHGTEVSFWSSVSLKHGFLGYCLVPPC